MTFEQLKQFSYTAKLKNFTRAAEALYVSHSSISRNVSMLEHELGVLLFERNNRNVKLTPAGETLLHWCERIRINLDEMVNEVRRVGSGSAGKLTISMMDFYDERLFNIIKMFCHHYPDIQLLMQYCDSSQILYAIRENLFDIGVAFSFEIENNNDDLEEIYDSLSIYKDSFVAVVAVDHPLAGERHVNISDLQSNTVLTLEETSSVFVNEILKHFRIDKQQTKHKATSLGSLLLQIKAGQGVALIPRPLMNASDTSKNGLSLIELQDLDTSFNVMLFWKHDNPNPSLKLFTDTLYDEFNNLVRD